MKKQQRSKAKAECASSAKHSNTWKEIDFSKCECKVRKLQIRIAILFSHCNVDGFFLEYDSDRSGSFEPLRFIKNQTVVLGLITSKFPELEDKDAVKARIEEATKYVPLNQLCLSPQCGFSSTEEGNIMTEEQQWAKVRLVREIADEVWGDK